jgi:putative membrane protein
MNIISNLFNGAIIGVANIIPGVSGGTMALILGFYERLISAINSISIKTILIILKTFSLKKKNIEQLIEELKRVDAYFLITIAFGSLLSIISLARLMPILLQDYHDPTYGFFFGLILVSAISPYKLIKKKSIAVFLIAVFAIALIVMVTNLASGKKLLEKEQTKIKLKQEKLKNDVITHKINENSLDVKKIFFMFIIGAIAISAMILPGISGSFLLLILGGYIEILKALSNHNFPILISFSAGCLIGVIIFSRLINFLLKKWHDLTMGFLVGLVVGSLWMIWPFKTQMTVGSGTVFEKVVHISNKLPEVLGVNELYTGFAIIAGIIIVMSLLIIESKRA